MAAQPDPGAATVPPEPPSPSAERGRPGQPDDPFVRFDARVLDPATAVRPPDGIAPAATAYRGDRLLITAPTVQLGQARIATVDTVAAQLGLRVAGPSPFALLDRSEEDPVIADHNQLARLLALAEQTATPLVFPLRFRPVDDKNPAPAVDVWPLLQRLRAGGDADLAAAVGLDHLMFAAVGINGNPYSPHGLSVVTGNPYSPHGLAAEYAASYLAAGTGGHGPVAVVLHSPQLDPTRPEPSVVVLDTGVGVHPWFTDRPVTRPMQESGGTFVGLDPNRPDVTDTDPEGEGAVGDLMTGGLTSHAGHGTFICGLLRQTCPNAAITALRIMDADGVVPEDRLTTALIGLGIKLAQEPGTIDALVLSLGYYAETREDERYSAGLLDLLRTIAGRGVVTFAAAGNDSSQRRCYPAGFADYPGFDDLPLVAVAALNPDGSVALFSNDGPWVLGAAPGANVVSTSPVVAQGSLQAGVSFSGPGNRERATIDPDDFSSGFATWSGTSFAAPVLAGQFLAALVDKNCPADVSERRKLIPLR